MAILPKTGHYGCNKCPDSVLSRNTCAKVWNIFPKKQWIDYLYRMNVPRTKSFDDTLNALMERCARAETCVSDARRLMSRWGVPTPEQENILARLLHDRFIDEERYAGAFVRDKLNFSRWGTRKIAEALYQKRIPAPLIRQAMEQTEGVAMTDRLEADLRRKNSAIREENPYKRREKLLRFGTSRGYDYETVTEAIERVLAAADDR